MRQRSIPFFVFALILFWSGCKKDTVSPIITLVGEEVMEIPFGSIYNEPGAVARDDVDGSITQKIEISGSVDGNTVGSYTITYTVADDAGNIATAERTVNVVMVQTNFLGMFNESDNCGIQNLIQSSSEIIQGASETEIKITGFYLGADMTANLNGMNITVPQQTLNTVGIDGSGSIDAAGNVITLDLNFDFVWPIPDESCRVIYTRQQ